VDTVEPTQTGTPGPDVVPVTQTSKLSQPATLVSEVNGVTNDQKPVVNIVPTSTPTGVPALGDLVPTSTPTSVPAIGDPIAPHDTLPPAPTVTLAPPKAKTPPPPPTLTQAMAQLKLQANPDTLNRAKQQGINLFLVSQSLTYMVVEGFRQGVDAPAGSQNLANGFWFTFQNGVIAPTTQPSTLPNPRFLVRQEVIF
jgi:hypothetical protein